MRFALVAIVFLAIGVGGTLGVQHFTRSEVLTQLDVEREAARVAVERDGRDDYHSNCRPRPYPEGRWTCHVDWADRYSTYDVRAVDGRAAVGKEELPPAAEQGEFDFDTFDFG